MSAALSLMLALAVSVPCAAQDADIDVDLAQARLHYRELRFEEAVQVLLRIVQLPEPPPDRQLRDAYEYLGSAYAVLDRPADAANAFHRMLEIDPYYQIAERSPKITEILDRVRAEAVPDAALDPGVALRVDLPRAVRVGRDAEVRVRIEGDPDGKVTTVQLFHRGLTERDFQSVEARGSGEVFEVSVPARISADEIQLYVLGRDSDGRVVARGGDPLAPLTVTVRGDAEGGSRPDGPPRRRWLWALVGVAAVGLAVGIGVAVRSEGGDIPAGTLPPGREELP